MTDAIDGSRMSFTLGAGIRVKNFSADLAIVHTRFDLPHFPYTFDEGSNLATPVVNVENRITTPQITVSFSF